MQRIKIYQRRCFLLFFSFWSMTSFLLAQPNLPVLDFENQIEIKNELTFIPESRFRKKYYYLPKQLIVKKNDRGNHMFSLMKYAGENNSGTILNVHFSFEPEKISSSKIQEILFQNRPDAFYMGTYPFYYHKNFYGKFENIDLIMELVEGSKRKEFWRHKAALTSTGLVIAANLPMDEANLIWNTITQNKRQTIEFKIEVQTSSLEQNNILSIIFNPLKLKDFLLNHPDSNFMNQSNFENTIQSMLSEQEESLLQINGETESYEPKYLNKIIADKVAEILLEPTQHDTSINQITFSQTRKITRKITINGKVVEQESTIENGSQDNNSETNIDLKVNPDEYLSTDLQEYYLGEKKASEQTYPLYFNLSDFYREHQSFFKKNEIIKK